MARIAFGQNDQRARFLSDALKGLGHELVEVDFDHIDLITKALAAALTINHPRSEWWESYQTHPLVQRRRASVFERNYREALLEAQAVITWGSWFCPSLRSVDGKRIKYTYYIDQSRSTTPEEGESRGLLPRPRSGNRLQGMGYQRAERVMCMSNWAVEQSRRAHPFVDPAKFDWAGWGPCAFDGSFDPPASPPRSKKVLLVANDFYRKGVDWFTATAERVRSLIPDAEFVLIGKDQGNLAVRFADHVQYLGPIYDKAILKQHFAESSVFFLPNRFDRSPHVLIESLSMGVPIVVSDQGGAAELIERAPVGIKVRTGVVDEYADALVRLLSDEKVSREMGNSGKNLVRTTYNWSEVAKRVLSTVGL